MDKAYQQYMRFSLIQNIALIAAVVFFATFTQQYWAFFFIFLLIKEFPLVNPGPSSNESDEDPNIGFTANID